MNRDLNKQQSGAKHVYFSQQISALLKEKNIAPSPIVVAKAINKHYNSDIAKPHTVRKWLLGLTQPKSEALLLIANWLGVEPKQLIAKPTDEFIQSNRVSFEFDFTDQEVIKKYLSMTIKQKVTVRLLIDAIAEKK
jgi:transcriptional regulator with XRE-family HTH domain